MVSSPCSPALKGPPISLCPHQLVTSITEPLPWYRISFCIHPNMQNQILTYVNIHISCMSHLPPIQGTAGYSCRTGDIPHADLTSHVFSEQIRHCHVLPRPSMLEDPLWGSTQGANSWRVLTQTFPASLIVARAGSVWHHT